MTTSDLLSGIKAVADDTRDKVMGLMRDMQHMTEKVDRMSEQLTELHDVLLRARGAQWVLMIIAGLAGGILVKLGTIAAWFGGKSP